MVWANSGSMRTEDKPADSLAEPKSSKQH